MMEKLGYSYNGSQITLPIDLSNRIIQWSRNNINPDDLYRREGDGGYDLHPHVTLKYGLIKADPSPVAAAARKISPIESRLGKLSVFDAKDYDVLKLEVHGEGLHRANKLIADHAEHIDTHPQYNPHVTVAYLKKGTAGKYLGDDTFYNKKFISNNMEFTYKDGRMTKIPFRGGHVDFTEKLATDIMNAVIEKTAALEEKTAGITNPDKKLKKKHPYAVAGAQLGAVFSGSLASSILRDIQAKPVNAVKNRLYSLVHSAAAKIVSKGH